jgi:hypothetical protein
VVSRLRVYKEEEEEEEGTVSSTNALDKACLEGHTEFHFRLNIAKYSRVGGSRNCS